MAIRGSISDVSVTDVLQLLKHGARTGKLEITEADGRRNALFVERGRVIFAETDGEVPRLGELLVESQLLSKEAKDKFLDEYAKKRKPGLRFGDFLVNCGVIEKQSLIDIVTKKLEAIVFRTLSLPQGDFVFNVSEEMPDEDILIALDLDSILLQCMKREGDWVNIRKIIPNFNIRFIFSTNDFVKMSQNGVRLSWMEWNVLNLLDGSRTVSDIAERLRQDDMLNLCKMLKDLFDKGFIRKYDQSYAALPGQSVQKKKVEIAGKTGLVKRLINRIKGL